MKSSTPQDTHPLKLLASEVFSNMLRTSGHLAHQQAQLLKSFGLSRTQFDALRILRSSDGGSMPILAVANRMITRVPDITRLIDRLEQEGLVERCHSERDRRVVLVRLREKARHLLQQVDDPLRRLTGGQIGHMSTDELETLNNLLLKARSPA
jgi:DNA-binding MarR family transcriptional regulator